MYSLLYFDFSLPLVYIIAPPSFCCQVFFLLQNKKQGFCPAFQNLINVGLCFNFLVILRFMAEFKSSSRIGKAINSCDNDIYTSAIFSTILLYCGSLFTNCSTNLVLEMQQLSMIFSFVAALAIHSMLNLSNIIADGSTRFLFKVWFSNIFVLALGFVPFSSRFKNFVTTCA